MYGGVKDWGASNLFLHVSTFISNGMEWNGIHTFAGEVLDAVGLTQ